MPRESFIVTSSRQIFLSASRRAGPKQIKILDFGLAKQQGAGDLQDSGGATATFGGQATSAGTSAGTVNPDLTSPGSTLGTVAYMSPEQAKGEPLDARTDLFSLGAVIYEMATGSKPFAGHSTAELFVALLTKDPAPVTHVNPAMPTDLDAIVAKLLAKEKEQRYQSAEELSQDLEELDAQASHGPSGQVSGGKWNGTRRRRRSAPAAPGMCAACSHTSRRSNDGGRGTGMLLLAGGFAWWKHRAAAGPAGERRQQLEAPIFGGGRRTLSSSPTL